MRAIDNMEVVKAEYNNDGTDKEENGNPCSGHLDCPDFFKDHSYFKRRKLDTSDSELVDPLGLEPLEQPYETVLVGNDHCVKEEGVEDLQQIFEEKVAPKKVSTKKIKKKSKKK